MSLVIALLIGGFIGWLAAVLMGRDEGFFASIAIGVVGAFLGGALANFLAVAIKATYRLPGLVCFGLSWGR